MRQLSVHWTSHSVDKKRGFAISALLRQESHDQVFCTIFLHQFFLSYHTWTQFSCSASPLTDVSGFFSKPITQAITCIFFAIKAFMQELRNFFEICRSNSNIMQYALCPLVVMYMACSVHRGHVTAL